MVEFIVEYWIEVALGLICAGFGCAFKNLSSKIKKRNIEDAAMREATLALLDDRMGQLFRFCKEKKYVTREELRRYERMYAAYQGQGGNGTVTTEHKQFCRMELREDQT